MYEEFTYSRGFFLLHWSAWIWKCALGYGSCVRLCSLSYEWYLLDLFYVNGSDIGTIQSVGLNGDFVISICVCISMILIGLFLLFSNAVNEEQEKPRSLRFTWSMKTTSSRDPNEIMTEIRKVRGIFVVVFLNWKKLADFLIFEKL